MLKKTVLKQKLDNSKCKTDTSKQDIPKSKTGGRPQIMSDKVVLRNFASFGSQNTDLTKILNVGRNLVARCVKFHGFPDALREPQE